MIELVDFFIWQKSSNPIICDIIKTINQRKLPKMVYQSISISPIEFDESKLIEKFSKDKYEIIRFKVGYVGCKSQNPLNHINFYNIKNNMVISENKVKDFSLLINQKYQEYFLRVYCTDLTQLEEFNKYFSKEKSDDIEDSPKMDPLIV